MTPFFINVHFVHGSHAFCQLLSHKIVNVFLEQNIGDNLIPHVNLLAVDCLHDLSLAQARLFLDNFHTEAHVLLLSLRVGQELVIHLLDFSC